METSRRTFLKKYPQLKEVGGGGCAVCHIGKPAGGKFNDYGAAFGKHLANKEKAPEATDRVDEALKKTEDDPSGVEGKTFGDLIRAGTLPGKTP